MSGNPFSFNININSEGKLDHSVTEQRSGSFASYRITLVNNTDSDAFLNEIKFQLTELMGKGFGEKAFCGYKFFRQGRHKNDLPSVCTIGVIDSAFEDCFGGLKEDGTSNRAFADRDLMISDPFLQITGENETALLGFTSQEKMLGFVRAYLTDDLCGVKNLEISLSGDHMLIAPGESVTTDEIYISVSDCPFRQIKEYTERIKEIGTPVPKCKYHKPTLYSTWYYYGDSVSEDDVNENLEWLEKRMPEVDVFQIDEGWEWKTGDWIANLRFPSGMKKVAENIRAHGFDPGLWTSPFIIDPRCGIRFYHTDWLLRKKDGTPVRFHMNDMDNLVLDPTHPGVQQWLREMYTHLAKECGYLYHKFDFTRAVAQDPDAVFYDKRATRATAYREGFKVIRDAIGDEGYLLICGGLYLASYGIANGQRTGSDVKSLWQFHPGEEEELPYQIKQNLLRYWMNDLWDNDADSIMVRRQEHTIRDLDLTLGKLTDSEARIMAHNQQMAGGIISFTEPMKYIDEDRLKLIRDVHPSNGFAAVPLDMYSGKRYPGLFIADTDDENKKIITLSNWTAKDALRTLPLNITGFDNMKVYDHYTGEFIASFGKNAFPQFELMPHSVAVYDIIKD